MARESTKIKTLAFVIPPKFVYSHRLLCSLIEFKAAQIFMRSGKNFLSFDQEMMETLAYSGCLTAEEETIVQSVISSVVPVDSPFKEQLLLDISCKSPYLVSRPPHFIVKMSPDVIQFRVITSSSSWCCRRVHCKQYI